MDYYGFYRPYPKNRPLTQEELDNQLFQKKFLNIDPMSGVDVIRFNSTYMEMVDKWFLSRGFASFGAFAELAIGLATLIVFPLLVYFEDLEIPVQLWIFCILILLISFLPLYWSYLLFKTDAFRLTHYPIRLNRKTRKVHAFLPNGTVLTVPWDELFICIVKIPGRLWEIQAHVLDKDKKTVKETFALSPNSMSSKKQSDELLPRYWEFIRRYMEEGPQAVSSKLQICMPIADQRESFVFGFERLRAYTGPYSFSIQLTFLFVFAFVLYPFRWFAMRTSKIPQWPLEIEAQCQIAGDDPWRKEVSDNRPLPPPTMIYIVAAYGVAVLLALALAYFL